MEYVYSATGEKRSVTYNVLVAGGNYTYCGNFVYYNGYLNQILVDGGYISFSGSSPVYYYYLKDHLGSNRVTVKTNGTVINVSHYYPFGGLFGESTGSSDMAYRYNGKEFERLIGLDWYDYGARHMAPDAPRFTTMDPMAEKYYNVSPYAYCANNPVNAIDPDGREVEPDEKALTIIRNTLSQKEQRFVTLNNEGKIDINRLSQCGSKSNNFMSLMTLVESPLNIIVTVLDQTTYIQDGLQKQEYFNPVEIDDDYKDTNFSSPIGNTTGEIGNLGVTYMPTNGDKGKGPHNDSVIHININPTLSPLGAAETFSHEGYGHAYLYVTTNGNRNAAIHHYLPGGKDGNNNLRERSINARIETVKNKQK